MPYKQFIFHDYVFDEANKRLDLIYKIDGQLTFTESYKFDFEFADYRAEALDRAAQLLFFVAGVSYYKTYMPPEIVVSKGSIDSQTADFLAKTYQKGLGEFFYINKLDPNTRVNFPVNSETVPTIEAKTAPGRLIGIGGGKDSLVSVELLRGQPRVATWSVGHRSQLEPLVKTIDLPHFWVERTWDRQLLELNSKDAYNGHVPISAILAAAGAVAAILCGYQDIMVSNESSASEPNLTYQGVPINHQYSKSLEFEKDFQSWLRNNFGDSLNYYSFLRPLSEVRIGEVFAKTGFEKYKDVFSSCNRAFVHSSDSIFWCGECPKCAFVFLALSPFVPREKLETLWNGKNLLLNPSLEPTYRQLLGIEGDKPLDCVGEVKESRAAMRLAQQIYPELSKYQFDIPAGYDYKELKPDSMPAETHKLLFQQLANIAT